MARRTPFNEALLVRAATAFDTLDDDAETTEYVVDVPEDLSTLDDDALAAALDNATEAFHAVAPDPDDEDAGPVSSDDLDAMEALADTIESLHAEQERRTQEATERAERAAALQARVAGDDAEDSLGSEEEEDDTPAGESEEGDAAGQVDEDDEDAQAVVAEAEKATREAADEREPVTASGKRKSVNLVVQGRGPRRERNAIDRPATAGRELTFRAAGGGRNDGHELDARSLGEHIGSRVRGVSTATIESAKRAGRHFSQKVGTAYLDRREQPGFRDDLVIDTDDPERISAIIDRATDERLLEGGSLTAAGTGWCSPSEVMYDLFDCGLAPGAGLLSLPEVTFARGGIIYEPGISFSDVNGVYSGFNFTEAEAEAGDYGSTGSASDKPCYEITCGTPEEVRLNGAGICLTGDILQRRTNPERIARFTDVALAAHMRRMSDLKIAAMAAASTAITQPAGQVGAVAPTLSFFELIVEYERNRANLAETATMESVLPHWVRGAFRADLARRLGVDLIDVGNARLDAHLRSRGIEAQYVYGWQGLDAAVSEGGTAGAPPTQWPTSFTGLVYPSGTWVAGTADIIEIDTLYDSTLLAQNKYTALFTEEGWAVFNKGCDSYAVSFNIEADGATHGGIGIEADGTATPVV